MSEHPQAEPPRRWAAAAVLGIALGCGGDASLDGLRPPSSAATEGDGDDGSTSLPPLGSADDPSGTDDGDPPSTGGDGSGLCEEGCRITLPVQWRYEGSLDTVTREPGSHRVPAMLREPDGTLTVVEQRRGFASLHRLDRWGALQWNQPLPLPCDFCEVGGLALHPSGDLLLSASGLVIDGAMGLLAARWDPITAQTRWVSTQPLSTTEGVLARAGQIEAVSDALAVQLYLEGQLDFTVQQRLGLAVYGLGGVLVERTVMSADPVHTRREPLLAQRTTDGELAVALPRGQNHNPYTTLDRMEAPLWGLFDAVSVPEQLDDFLVDERDHTLSLGHTFDGEQLYLVLVDRVALEEDAVWVATLAVPSTSEGYGALARSEDGELYAAYRTTQYPVPPPEEPPGEEGGPAPEPLTGLSLARWSPGGELRWQSTVLLDLAESDQPLALAVDEQEGLIVAGIVGDRLRVERREQRCQCD